MKQLKPKNFILRVKVTDGTTERTAYVSRVTESTILTIDSEQSESQWRVKDGVKRKDHKWSITDTSHSTLIHLLTDRFDPTEPKTTDTGFRTICNSRGEQVYTYPTLKQFKNDKDKWLKALGFKIINSY